MGLCEYVRLVGETVCLVRVRVLAVPASVRGDCEGVCS